MKGELVYQIQFGWSGAKD